MTSRARLDADRTATPLTEIVVVVLHDGKSLLVHTNMATEYLVRVRRDEAAE